MKFTLPITLLATSLIATTVEAMWKPGPGVSWDYLLGASDSTIKESDKDVVTIDLEYAEKFVPYFHEKGQRVICYFSGGTMQESRKVDYQDYLDAHVQISHKSGWDNHYIDIRKKDKLYPLIKKRMQRAVRFNCDGVEVDSLGLYLHVDGFTKDDTITFGKWVAELAHSEGLAIGLKNVAGCAQALEPYFDFAVVESCAESSNVCKLYTPFVSHGKAVFTVHYGNRLGKLGSSPSSTLSRELGGHGFTCAFNENQNVHHNSSNFDCSKGNYSSDSGSKPSKESTTTKTSTSTTSTSTSTIKADPTIKSNPVIPNPIGQTTKQVDPSNPGSKTAPGAPGAPGNATNSTQPATKEVGKDAAGKDAAGKGAAGKETGKEVGKGVGNDKTDKKDEGGSGLGTAVAVVAAGGGLATAAVAGFIFMKKNKKFSFSTKNDDISLA